MKLTKDRNVYNGDSNVPIVELNTFVRYVRQTQQALMEETDETLISESRRKDNP